MSIVLWFAFLLAMAYVYQLLTQWVTRFSIFTVFFGCLFLRFGVAIPFTDNITRDTVGITMPPGALLSFHVALVIVYLTIAATLLAFRLWAPVPKPAVREAPANTTVLLVLILAAAAITFLVWVLLPWKEFIGGLGLFTSLSHTDNDYANHREEYSRITASNSVINYVGALMRFAFLPTLVWIALFHIRYWRVLLPVAAGSLVLLALIGFATGQKQPELYLGVGLLFALLVRLKRPNLLSWKIGVVALVGLFGVLPLLYHVQYPSLDYGSLIAYAPLRLVSVYSLNTQLRFYFYPNFHPFLYGASSMYVEMAMRLVHINTSGLTPPETYIPQQVLGSSFNLGSWNTGYPAEAWADFGFVGCFLESVVVALLLAFVDRWYVSSARTPITQGTYVGLLIATTYMTDVALTTALWTYGFLPALILLWLLRRSSTFSWRATRLAVARRLAAAKP